MNNAEYLQMTPLDTEW